MAKYKEPINCYQYLENIAQNFKGINTQNYKVIDENLHKKIHYDGVNAYNFQGVDPEKYTLINPYYGNTLSDHVRQLSNHNLSLT